MPKQEIKKYQKQVNVRFENAEWENIQAVATSQNHTVSSFIREVMSAELKYRRTKNA